MTLDELKQEITNNPKEVINMYFKFNPEYGTIVTLKETNKPNKEVPAYFNFKDNSVTIYVNPIDFCNEVILEDQVFLGYLDVIEKYTEGDEQYA